MQQWLLVLLAEAQGANLFGIIYYRGADDGVLYLASLAHDDGSVCMYGMNIHNYQLLCLVEGFSVTPVELC